MYFRFYDHCSNHPFRFFSLVMRSMGVAVCSTVRPFVIIQHATAADTCNQMKITLDHC